MTKQRVVHYAAHGTSGVAFDCYHAEMKAHLDSSYKVTPDPDPNRWSAPKTLYRLNPPKGHTDLRRVTCPACWKEIRAMADGRSTYRNLTTPGRREQR